MEFSFEINTIATVGADVARKAAKRKRNSTAQDPEPVKQQKFNNGAPFTAKSPPRCSREHVALKEEIETSEHLTPEDDSVFTTMSSARPKHKLRRIIKEEGPSELQKLDDASPLRSSTQSNTPALKEEMETSDERAHEHSSIIPTTSSSQAKFKCLSTVEVQVPGEQQMPDDNSLLSTSTPPKTSTVTEEAKSSEQQAPQNGPSSQAKRTRLITIEERMPRKQRKLNDGSPLRISSRPRSSTLTEEGSSSPAKRTLLSTIEDELPRKLRKLEDGFALNTSSQSHISLHSPADVTSSNSASRSTTPAEANPRKGGRPRADKQFPRQKELRVRTKLRTNRPVKNEIPFEIWQSVLENCPLEFLLKAVNIPHFSDILLRNENTWKTARVRQFGHDMPDPPPGISEHKYANLLVGSGCHGCGDKLTRKVYWGFVRRWCDNCLKKNVLQKKTLETSYSFRSVDDKEKGDYFEKISECVPNVWYDSWHHYQWVGDYEEPPVWAKIYPNGQHRRFSRVRFNQMEGKVRESSLKSSSTEEEIEAFFAPYIAENIAYTERLQQIEGWWMTHRMFQKSEVAALKGDRETNFKERALHMDPPLQPEALELCPSYQRAKKIASPFTEKVWSVLKSKLVKERAAAEFEVSFPLTSVQPRLHATYY